MRNLQFAVASLAVTTTSAMYQAFYVAPTHSKRFDHLDKKMDILYSRNGMHIRSKYNYSKSTDIKH
uniref:Uncharacterized protein n=1 Tax=viral metagenome TaxID=1070528 RepID=A0A6C0KKP2_9ZZZZ